MTYVDTECRILEQLVIMDRESARSWRSDDPWKVLKSLNVFYGSPSSEKSFLYLKYLQYMAEKKTNEQSSDKRLS